MGTPSRPLNPMADIFVRYLLGSEQNKDILIHFINAVFAQKGHEIVVDLELRNPFNFASVHGEKESILDVKAKDKQGRWLNVEVQIENSKSFAQRSLYYWAKNYSDQLSAGTYYTELAPTICINLLDFEIFPQLPGYHSCFQITEVDIPQFVLSEHFQLHFIEIPKHHKIELDNLNDKLEGWIYYFKNERILREDEMNIPFQDDPIFQKAHRVYQEFTANEELMDLVESREKWRKDVNTRLHEAEKRGMEQGIEQGMQQKALESARKMVAENLSTALIAKFTGLTEEEIKKI